MFPQYPDSSLKGILSLPVHQVDRPVEITLGQRFPNFGGEGRGQRPLFNLLKPNDIYIYIYIYMSYRSANLQTLHFKYLLKKYTY